MSGSATECTREPMAIQNANKTGSGLMVGDNRIYTCEGDYKWAGMNGTKSVYCQGDGTWSALSSSCICMFLRESTRRIIQN